MDKRVGVVLSFDRNGSSSGFNGSIDSGKGNSNEIPGYSKQ
jgi:hypothetical protein